MFEHLHSLDFTYHVGRQTGGLGRAIDRGTRGINFILSSMIFNVVPTALEVLLVAGILAHKCGAPLAGLALATLVAYTWFTFTMTAWRTQFRVRMNKMDAKASTRAIDALLNYETVRSRPRGGCPAPLRPCGPGGVAEPGAARRRRRRVCLSVDIRRYTHTHLCVSGTVSRDVCWECVHVCLYRRAPALTGTSSGTPVSAATQPQLLNAETANAAAQPCLTPTASNHAARACLFPPVHGCILPVPRDHARWRRV